MPALVCQVRALSKQAGELSACICVQQPNRPKEQGGEKNKTKEINEEPRFSNVTSETSLTSLTIQFAQVLYRDDALFHMGQQLLFEILTI